jgi:RNA polymerase sigma-70 factor, ECF subfamily
VSSESDLLQQAQRLEGTALAEIYDCYSVRVYRYAFRLLGDTCLAEDCVAETFSRFLHGLRNGQGPREHIQAYLFRTAHNLVVDHYRRSLPMELDEEIPDVVGVEVDVDQRIRQHDVRAAIQELTPAQQQVIALKFWEDWENEDIAQFLHKPVGAIKSLQHRALAHLQKILLDEKSSKLWKTKALIHK